MQQAGAVLVLRIPHPPATARSPAMASSQGDRVGRVVRHQLADAIDLAVGHAQHAAYVAQSGPGLQLTEGDDLRDACPRP